MLVFEIGAQVKPVVEPVIQATTERDEIVADVGREAAVHEALVRGKVYDAAAVENLSVGSEPATIVVPEIPATDLVRSFGEVIAGNQGVGVGISDSMKVGFDAVVAEEVIVGVEGEASDVVWHVIRVYVGVACANLE